MHVKCLLDMVIIKIAKVTKICDSLKSHKFDKLVVLMRKLDKEKNRISKFLEARKRDLA